MDSYYFHTSYIVAATNRYISKEGYVLADSEDSAVKKVRDEYGLRHEAVYVLKADVMELDRIKG